MSEVTRVSGGNIQQSLNNAPVEGLGANEAEETSVQDVEVMRRILRSADQNNDFEELKRALEEGVKTRWPDIFKDKKVSTMRLLQQVTNKTEGIELNLEAITATTAEKAAVGAQNNVKAGNKELQDQIDVMSGLKDDNDEKNFSKANTKYNEISQRVSARNNTINNCVQVTQTTVTAGTQTYAQLLDFLRAIYENNSALTSMLARSS